jgi:MarR family transcriptional regulator, lower aerobic nicotinate degradation pathway regulator
MESRSADLSTPAATRVLTPVDGLTQLSFLIHRMLERRAAEQDLSIVQTRLLGVLRDRRPTMNELGKLLALDKSSISGLVERAERRGLVTRTPSPVDGRAVLVSLTANGHAIVAKASAQFGADVLALLDRLSPSDRRALPRLVSRLLVAHAADHGIDLFPSTDSD